jgi:exodeoxyribonuclease-3
VKIASYNVNGVNGRLPHLLEWLAESSPDVVCLQELKTDDSKFPIGAVESFGSFDRTHASAAARHGDAVLGCR